MRIASLNQGSRMSRASIPYMGGVYACMLSMGSKTIYQIAVISALIMVCSACKPSPDSVGNYQIGVSAPLTGESANYGRSTREGVELAADQINAEDPLDRPLKVIFEDDEMNPRQGVTAVSKLITADNVPIIVGPFGSSVVLATAPIAERNHVVLLSASATADDIATAGDFIFRIAPPNSRQGANIAEFLRDQKHVETAAVIYQNNDYGVTLMDAFKKRFNELGGKVLATEAVEEGVTDLRGQITKLREVSPASVFFPLHYAEAGLFLRQAADLGLKAVFVSADGAMTQGMLDIAGNTANGTFYTSLALDPSQSPSKVDSFKRSFLKQFGHQPDVYATYYYDATRLAADAIRSGGYSGPAIRDYLYRLTPAQPFHGITGNIYFDSNGEVFRGFSLYRAEEGKFEQLTTAN